MAQTGWKTCGQFLGQRLAGALVVVVVVVVVVVLEVSLMGTKGMMQRGEPATISQKAPFAQRTLAQVNPLEASSWRPSSSECSPRVARLVVMARRRKRKTRRNMMISCVQTLASRWIPLGLVAFCEPLLVFAQIYGSRSRLSSGPGAGRERDSPSSRCQQMSATCFVPFRWPFAAGRPACKRR